MATLTLYDPTAPRAEAAAAGPARGTVLAGAVIGFIDNAKPNFNHLADDLGALLVARYGAARVVKCRKTSASIAATPEMIAAITGECDVVIAGSGD